MNLSGYKKIDINKNHSKFKIFIWYYMNAILFNSPFFPIYRIKAIILRMFGANVGANLCIKPNVSIKYPWKLNIGNFVSIGEGVWIDNITDVSIGSNSCISQGAYICTGNHDYKSSLFDLILGEVSIGENCWIGARGLILPNTVFENGAILAAGSVASGILCSNAIYKGHPAKKIRERYDS